MTTINDGGPIYPQTLYDPLGMPHEHCKGISLRDGFAMYAPPCPPNWVPPKALLETLGHRRPGSTAEEDTARHSAYLCLKETTWRWAHADMMIAMRSDQS